MDGMDNYIGGKKMHRLKIKATVLFWVLACVCACSGDLSRETIACHVVDEPLLSGGETRLRIVVMNGDGSHRREIGEGLEVAWSPDGRKLAYVGRDYNSLHVVDVLSGRSTCVADLGDLVVAFEPDWSPDGQYIAFRVTRWNIWVVDADGSNLRQLTDYPEGTCVGAPSWSPDGSRVAFSVSRSCSDLTRSDIYVMNSDGSSVRRLTDGVGYYSNPVWSPREDRIAFNEYHDGKRSIYVMNGDGSGKSRRATGQVYDWSPDGTRIYYHQVRCRELWTVRWDMGNYTRLFTLPCTDPAWSPVIEEHDLVE